MSEGQQAGQEAAAKGTDSPDGAQATVGVHLERPVCFLPLDVLPKTQGRSRKYPRPSENEEGLGKQSIASEQTAEKAGGRAGGRQEEWRMQRRALDRKI